MHATIRPIFGLQTAALLALLLVVLGGRESAAQIAPDYQRYHPLNQVSTPGLAGKWAELRGLGSPYWFQPVQVVIEDGGEVAVYHNRPVRAVALPSPAQFGTLIGHAYRLRITNMPTLPGIELYPTIEVIDRMHPPTGEEHNFPVPIHITLDDINLALAGKLVTQVVYVEQPQLAAPFTLDEATRIRPLLPTDHPLEQADRYGRPIAILRMGGRLPAPHGESFEFYGTGGPIADSHPTRAVNGAAAPAASDTDGQDAPSGDSIPQAGRFRSTTRSGNVPAAVGNGPVERTADGASIRIFSRPVNRPGDTTTSDTITSGKFTDDSAPLLRLPDVPAASREEVVR